MSVIRWGGHKRCKVTPLALFFICHQAQCLAIYGQYKKTSTPSLKDWKKVWTKQCVLCSYNSHSDTWVTFGCHEQFGNVLLNNCNLNIKKKNRDTGCPYKMAGVDKEISHSLSALITIPNISGQQVVAMLSQKCGLLHELCLLGPCMQAASFLIGSSFICQ